MGRKGVSKRKPTKTKSPLAPSINTNSVVSTIAHAAEFPAPVTPGKGDKKKSSDSKQNNRKR